MVVSIYSPIERWKPCLVNGPTKAHALDHPTNRQLSTNVKEKLTNEKNTQSFPPLSYMRRPIHTNLAAIIEEILSVRVIRKVETDIVVVCVRSWVLSSIWLLSLLFCVASLANPAEDRLLNRLLHSRRYNTQTIPVSDVGQTVHIKLGLGVQKIIQVVCQAKY